MTQKRKLNRQPTNENVHGGKRVHTSSSDLPCEQNIALVSVVVGYENTMNKLSLQEATLLSIEQTMV